MGTVHNSTDIAGMSHEYAEITILVSLTPKSAQRRSFCVPRQSSPIQPANIQFSLHHVVIEGTVRRHIEVTAHNHSISLGTVCEPECEAQGCGKEQASMSKLDKTASTLSNTDPTRLLVSARETSTAASVYVERNTLVSLYSSSECLVMLYPITTFGGVHLAVPLRPRCKVAHLSTRLVKTISCAILMSPRLGLKIRCVLAITILLAPAGHGGTEAWFAPSTTVEPPFKAAVTPE